MNVSIETPSTIANVIRAREGHSRASAGELPDYASLLAARHAAHGRELRKIVSYLPTDTYETVLDAPCGDGFYSACFADSIAAGGMVVAADIDFTYLQTAESLIKSRSERAPIHLVRGDSYSLPFSTGTFDVAWCAQSLLSLVQPIQALAELRRVVRKGGHVAVLEEDRTRELSLRWPEDLETVVREAEQTALRTLLEDHEPPANPARQTQELLRAAGIVPLRQLTCAIHRGSPLGDYELEFLRLYFSAQRQRLFPFLTREQKNQLARYTSPDSDQYLPRQSSFRMTWREILTVGAKT